MSYARWSETSDVYVYAHYMGHVECCGCLLDDSNRAFGSAEEVVAHMQEHVEAGHKVPPHLLEARTYDADDFLPMDSRVRT